MDPGRGWFTENSYFVIKKLFFFLKLIFFIICYYFFSHNNPNQTKKNSWTSLAKQFNSEKIASMARTPSQLKERWDNSLKISFKSKFQEFQDKFIYLNSWKMEPSGRYIHFEVCRKKWLKMGSDCQKFEGEKWT